MTKLPKTVDLSRGKPPEDFYVSSIPDRMKVEEWREGTKIWDDTIPSSNWCALTCVRMLLLAEDLSAPSLDELFERACAANVYRLHEGKVGWVGAYHDSLTAFIGEESSLLAKRREDMTPDNVAEELADGNYALLSVSPIIRFLNNEAPVARTGHMVLVYGYEYDEHGERHFILQNGAGFASLNSQIAVRVSNKRLSQVFSGRGVFVSSRHL